MATMDHENQRIDSIVQIFWPVAHGRQRRTGRQSDADGGNPFQPGALHHRIGEMGGADHHRVNRAIRRADMASHMGKRRLDAGQDVLRGRNLDGGDNGVSIDQNGIRIGAANVNTDAFHENTDLKSMS